jgi:hypothetical protein
MEISNWKIVVAKFLYLCSWIMSDDALKREPKLVACKIILTFVLWRTLNKYTYVIWYTSGDLSYKDQKLMSG